MTNAEFWYGLVPLLLFLIGGPLVTLWLKNRWKEPTHVYSEEDDVEYIQKLLLESFSRSKQIILDRCHIEFTTEQEEEA